MEKPSYVIKTNEAVFVPTKKSRVLMGVKKCVWIIVVIIFIGSLIFRDNLFMHMTWTHRILLLSLASGTIFIRDEMVLVPSPMELQFYEDYLVLYLPKRYYSRHLTQMAIKKMKYDEITKCVYGTNTQLIYLYGNGTSTFYNYKSDGTIPETPTKVRNYTKGLIYFCTKLATDVDFKNEIEARSPLKVIVENR